MTVKKFYQDLLFSLKKRNDIAIKNFNIKYTTKTYDFKRVASKNIKPTDKIIFIRAGIHGDEIAGPLTILHYANEIIDYIHAHDFKVIIYPLGNPSGFEKVNRYNIDHDKGDCGNNDFLRYRLSNGDIIDDLGEHEHIFESWLWSSDKQLKISLPKETLLFQNILKKEPLKQVKALLDLHQDYILPNAKPAAYHYAYGNLTRYNTIIKKIEKLVPVYKNKKIGSGQTTSSSTNDKGFIVRHDGTLQDLFWRLGAEHSITVETTGITPLPLAEKINMIWIQGVADLLKKT